MNITVLHGRLTRDPETRQTKGDSAICTLSIATDRRVKEGESWVNKPDFHRVTVFGGQAKACQEHLRKGSSVVVHGSNRSGKYEKDGETKYTYEVVAERVEFGGKPPGEKTESSGGGNGYATPNQDDDIPF